MQYPYNDWREQRKVVTDPNLQNKIINAFILDKQNLERSGFKKKKVSETRDQLVFFKNIPYRVNIWNDGSGDIFTVEQVVHSL